MATSFKRKSADKGGKSHKKRKEEVTGSSTQQKRALKHERQSHRRHADAVSTAKEIWNKLRLKNNSPEEVHRLTSELMHLIRGKINEVALQHDASRVVQAAVQFGTAEERREVVEELCQSKNLPELCKVQYAHFVVLKIIKYCGRDADSVRLVVKALKGSMAKLAVHAVGARVVELLFATFPTKTTAPLKEEFYGPHFALFAANSTEGTTSRSLASRLENVPDKKASTLEFVLSLLNKGLEKELFGFVYFQELFAEYIDVASSNEIRSIAPSVVDHSIHMLSARAGTRVVAACASYGTAKDRKRIMKSLKGYTRSSLLHRDAYLAILRLVQMTDDTVSVHKSILAEILTTPSKEKDNTDSPLLEIALNDTGSRLFLMLLVAKDETRLKYLDPYEREILAPDPTVVEGGIKVPTSKKNPETRRKELVQYLRMGLIEMCTDHANVLLRSVPGSRVLREVYAAFQPRSVVDAVVAVCESEGFPNETNSSDKQSQPFLFEDQVGHLAVKNLIMCDAELQDKDGYSCLFSDSFCNAMESRLAKVGTSNRGSFVLTALLKVKTVRKVAAMELLAKKTYFEKLANAGSRATAGYEALLQELDEQTS